MQEEKDKVEEEIEEGQEIEIEEEKVEDDKQEVDADSKAPAEEEKQDDSDADDLSEYSESVKKRISKLTSKFREEERQRNEAIKFAESVKKQNEELKAKLNKLDSTYVGEFDTRVQSQSIAAKEAYRKAVEENDVDAMYEAQQNISRIAMQEAKLEQMKKDREEEAERLKANGTAPAQPAPEAPPPKPDPKAEDWAKKNTWFGQDRAMTFTAFEIHKDLVEKEGYDPQSDEYYAEVDKRIRLEFPHKFDTSKDKPVSKPTQTVASATRSPKTNRKSVRLTSSQVAIAKKLGVPLEEYAKQLMNTKEV